MYYDISSKEAYNDLHESCIRKAVKLGNPYVKRAEDELMYIDRMHDAIWYIILAKFVKKLRDKGNRFIFETPIYNSLIAYLMEITDIDSVKEKLDSEFWYGFNYNKKPQITLVMEAENLDLDIIECIKSVKEVGDVIVIHTDSDMYHLNIIPAYMEHRPSVREINRTVFFQEIIVGCVSNLSELEKKPLAETVLVEDAYQKLLENGMEKEKAFDIVLKMKRGKDIDLLNLTKKQQGAIKGLEINQNTHMIYKGMILEWEHMER